MKIVKGGGIKPQRGRTLSLLTHPDVTAPYLLDQALKKMRDFDQNLDDGPFILLYPDGSEVVNIPGTQIPFVLKKYKEEIGKSYQRITIYICPKKDFDEGKLCLIFLVVSSAKMPLSAIWIFDVATMY